MEFTERGIRLNRVILTGRLTADPELRYTQTNLPVATFAIAVDRRQTGEDGKKVADFFQCVAWRGTGEFVKKYFSKGSRIFVEGHIQNRDWTDKDGNKRRSTEIVCDNVEFGDSKKDNGSNADTTSGGSSYNPVNVAAPADFEELPDDEDELPF